MLRLIKIIYGLCQAPKTFFDKLWAGHLEQGFIQSKLDPCLFMKYNMIFLVYVDDAILYGPNKQAIEAEIKILGISSDEHRRTFWLRDEG